MGTRYIPVDAPSRIFIEHSLLLQEWHYIYGDKKNELVTFTYYQVKTGKETERKFTYRKALELATSRQRDKRYKNYKFYISK